MKHSWLLMVLVGCASTKESVLIPGTSVRFDLVRIEGWGRTPAFWMGTREVTWAEFNRYYEFPGEEALDGVTRPSSGKDYLALSGCPNDFMLPERPVTNLRYHAAISYCEWLSRKTGAVYRLPTEIEWDIACGEVPADAAWTDENSGGRTHVGGEKAPHASGAFDLTGNVWEYSLESERPPDFDPVILGGAWNSRPERRQTLPADWSAGDPNRPFSTWWFRSDHSQGFRVVRVGEPSGKSEREAYSKKIEIGGLKGTEHDVKVGKSVSLFVRVTGTIRNSGDRSLDEVLVKVYYLNRAGKPHVEDVTNTLTRRATFNLAFPVLVSSVHAGTHAKPLAPGETREFAADVPASFDADDAVDFGKFGASVLSLRFRP